MVPGTSFKGCVAARARCSYAVRKGNVGFGDCKAWGSSPLSSGEVGAWLRSKAISLTLGWEGDGAARSPAPLAAGGMAWSHLSACLPKAPGGGPCELVLSPTALLL